MLLACQTEDSFLITNIYLHSTYSVFINVVLINVAYIPTHKNAKKLLFHQTYSSFNSSKTQKKKANFPLSILLWYKNSTPAVITITLITRLMNLKLYLLNPHHLNEVIQLLKETMSGFPGGAVVGNLPANTGDASSSPGLGRSHMPRSNWAREPQLLSLSVWSLCSATREATIVRGPRTAMKSGPHSPQLEKALIQKRRPNTAKNKNNK